MAIRKGDGAMTFTDMAADSLLSTYRKDFTETDVERERRDAVSRVRRWAKETFETQEEREEEEWKVLEVLGLDTAPIPSR